MVKETLVGQNLDESAIVAGERLVRFLDNAEFPVKAALWVRLPESHSWRLVLGTPEVRLEGPKKAYRKLQSHIRKAGIEGLSLADISLIDTTDPFIALLRGAVGTGSDTARIHFYGNVINGIRFPDSLIYRNS